MQTSARVQCPWCFEFIEVLIDPDTEGRFVRDCEVCCRPWDVRVVRDAAGGLQVTVQRSN